MFYSQFILAKKGPLGTIWIAAHLERKLRKNQVADTDIGNSVDSILFPDVPIALRLSSHLLLGVVRIYSRKVNYLFDDCSEALLKIKQAFRSTAVDLPPEQSTAPYHSITLPETFDLDDFELPDSDIFQGNYVDHHISSRDQITLQDTMDGVVYSTSQFGLDERFGDGDTSGLDFDEELLLKKVAAAEHDGVMFSSGAVPQESVEPVTFLKEDENHERVENSDIMISTASLNQIGDHDRDVNFTEYAQAPSTPGLLEEPNLSNVQETSACDDHLEPENQSLIESAVKENVENASSKSDNYNGNKNEVQGSSHSDANPDRVLSIPVIENGYLANDLESNRANPHGELSPNAVREEQIPSVNPDWLPVIPSALSDQVRATSTAPDSSNKTLAASAIPDGVEDPGNCSLNNNEPEIHLVEKSNEDYVEGEGVKFGKGVLGESAPLESNSESHSIPEIEGPEIRDGLIAEDSMVPDPSAVHQNMAVTDIHVFRPCVTQTSKREEDPCGTKSAIMGQGEGCNGSDDTTQGLDGNHKTVMVSCEDIQAANNQVNDHVENLTAGGDRQLGDMDSSITSELPAPEKLLSVQDVDVQNNLPPLATPDQVLTQTDGDADVRLTALGKKRSWTETALTIESLNSAESSGILRTKRTAESVPDDDDLLSSILVGRKSSVLKVKDTPLAERPSLKRHKPAPRTSASKRKVLMDDTMVLHGDMIRQQLTNTEDIRRLRKKAPCTRPEILMIQKQFLEDEIFNETIYTGVSMEFASLYNRTYDLRETRVTIDDVKTVSEGARDRNLTGSFLEAANDAAVFDEPNFTRETAIGESSDLMQVRDNDESQPIVTSLPMESQQCEEQAISLDLTGDVAETRSSQQLVVEGAEIDIDGKSIWNLDVLKPDADGGVHSSHTADALRDEIGDAQLASSYKMDEPGDSCINAPDLTADQQLDMFTAEIDANAVAGKSDDGVDAVAVINQSTVIEGVSTGNTECGASVEAGSNMQTECLSHMESLYPSTTFSLDTGRCSVDQANEEDKHAGAKEDSLLNTEVEYNGKYLVPNCGEELNIGSSYPAQVNADVQNAFLDDEVYSSFQETSQLDTMDARVSAIDLIDRDEFYCSATGNDTDFLNYDDDEGAEDDDDGMPNAEETHILENSGWSSRTRAVAKYLQTLFDKEAERGKKVLPMDRLLDGKSRKEASRMFFEALVLKTKDYIHVEQTAPFNNISILPKAKITKSEF